MEEDPHRLCRVELDVAVQKQQSIDAALALKLARELATWQFMAAIAIAGLIVAIFVAVHKGS